MNQTLAAKCTNASFGTQVVDRPKEVGTQLLQFSPRSKIGFFQKLDFLSFPRERKIELVSDGQIARVGPLSHVHKRFSSILVLQKVTLERLGFPHSQKKKKRSLNNQHAVYSRKQ
jgi:hypothetical protein